VEWPELDTSNFSVFHAAAKFADEYRTAGGLEVGGELQLIGGVYGRQQQFVYVAIGQPKSEEQKSISIKCSTNTDTKYVKDL